MDDKLKTMSFKDFTVVNPSMTDDEYLAYQAQKRRRGHFDTQGESVEYVDEGVGQFSVKKGKSTVIPGNDKDFTPDVKETKFDIVHKGKVVGDLRTDDYLGYIHGSLYGKDLPELSNYGTHRSSGISSTLHAFLKSKTGQKWATTGKLRGKNILEEVEQFDEAKAPSTVKHKGKTYYQTGKTGKDSKTGHPSFEYSSDLDGDDVRVWYNSKTKKVAMESVEKVDEVMDRTARIKASQRMKRMSKRIQMAKKRALKRAPNTDVIKSRAQRQARNQMMTKYTKGVPKSELSIARRAELEKRLKKMKGRVDKMAKKLIPTIRKQDRERRSGANKEK